MSIGKAGKFDYVCTGSSMKSPNFMLPINSGTREPRANFISPRINSDLI
jgi:hypothetical protein